MLLKHVGFVFTGGAGRLDLYFTNAEPVSCMPASILK